MLTSLLLVYAMSHHAETLKLEHAKKKARLEREEAERSTSKAAPGEVNAAEGQQKVLEARLKERSLQVTELLLPVLSSVEEAPGSGAASQFYQVGPQ